MLVIRGYLFGKGITDPLIQLIQIDTQTNELW